MNQLSLYIESIIFSTEKPITMQEMKEVLESYLDAKIDLADLEEAIQILEQKYESDDFSFSIKRISNGFNFYTKGSYHDLIGTHLKKVNEKKLSKAALETLAIIAYQQPITKAEMESIRGVNCDYTVNKLLEKDLVEILGRSDAIGKPILYGTSPKFMEFFGLESMDNLPQLKDIKVPEISVGEPAPEETEQHKDG